MSTVVSTIPERRAPGLRRLGRHVEHDPRSRGFSAVLTPTPLVSRAWPRYCPPFDQGDVGSCTCETMCGVLMTEPFYRATRTLSQSDCVSLYSDATRLDAIPGHYPPDDTGSSGLAAAKAAKRRGWLTSYRHAFGLHSTLQSLTRGPVMLGISWYESFDSPFGSSALLTIAGDVRGGHEVELLGIDVERKLVRGVNSWGESYGDHGYFTMSYDTLARLLHENGDVVVPVAA